MKKILQYLKSYKKEAILAPLFKLTEACFELLVPLVIASVIDTGIAHNDKSFIYSRGLILIVFGLIGLCSAITAQYFSAKVSTSVGTRLRDDLFSHIVHLSEYETGRIGQATLITRVTNDSNQIQNGVNMFFRLVLRSPFIVFGAMFMAFYIKGTEGLLFLLVITVLAVIVWILMRSTIKIFRNVQKKLDAVLLGTSENLSGMRVLRAFGKEEAQKTSFNKAANDLYSEQIYAGSFSALMNPLTYVVINLGLVAVLYTGAIQVNIGNMSQGDVVALVNYMAQILTELIKIANLVILLSKASACMKRTDEVFALKNSMADGTNDASDITPSVEFDHVGFTYPGSQKEALSDITFSAKAGETVGIIGGTGSGKSTVVNLIPRFFDSGSGRVLIGSRDVRDYSIASLRAAVGIVEQKNFLFRGSIEDNLHWGDEYADTNAMEEALKTAQAANVLDSKAQGLKSEVLQQGKNFSGGQKQRLSLARTFLKNPLVLILDDSSSALDYSTDAALRLAIKDKFKKTTVFIVSQRVTSIRYADKIIVMDEGRMAGLGNHEELLKSCALYREICHSQLSEEEL